MRQVLIKLLQKRAFADWKFVEETPKYLTGLRLQEVPTAKVQKADERFKTLKSKEVR